MSASSSDEELEKKLLEYGEMLRSPSPYSEQDLKTLDKLFVRLQDVDETSPASVQSAVSELTRTLIDERLLKHPNVDVKVAVAACITEVMRINPPVAYDVDKMREVLQLIVSSLEHLDEKYNSSYTRRTSILNTLAKCQICVMMLDPKYVDLLIEMFQLLLKGVRAHHPMNVILDIENIMTLVLKESDGVHQELLSLILRYVIKDVEVPLISRRLAEQVLTNCASKCKTYLAEAVRSSGVSLDKYSDVVASICEGAFSDLKQNKGVAHKKVLVGSSGKSVSKSKTDVKQPLEETFNTNTKRKHSLAKEKASDLQNYDEKLVGRSIKVWWPMDRAYYKGVVCSYDSSKRKHLVCYEDGDEEILNFKKQKWHFVDESESSEDQEANQTGSDEEACTMSQKKKARTGKAQSANKRARVQSCSLHKAHGETAAEREVPSCRTYKSSPEPKDPQACNVTHPLARVKQSIVDTITSVRQFRSELETKERSIIDTLISVRQFRSEIKKKEDNLEASLQEVDVLGKKIFGINNCLNDGV